VVFAPDGKTLAIGDGYSFRTNAGPPSAGIWIYDTGRRERMCPPIRLGEPIARPYRFSKDGTILYTKTLDRKTLRLWDAKTGKSLGRDIGGGPDTTDMAVSLDDLVVLQSDRKGRITRREIDGGKPLGEPWLIQPHGIDRIAVNPDGRTFLTRSAEGTARLWDIQSARPVGPPIEHDSRLLSAAVSQDGQTLATATTNGIVRFWDVPTGLPLGPPAPPAGDDAGLRLVFLPGGDRLAVSSGSTFFVVPTPGGIAGDLVQVRRWAEVQAGWAIDAAGTVARLNTVEWARRRQDLSAEFEGPAADPSPQAAERDRHLAIGLSSVGLDDYAAIWHLDRVLAGGSDDPALWLERADIHARLGHTELALGDLERVLALDPKRPTEWGYVLSIISALPRTDPVKDFESRALSRWRATTGNLSDISDPLVIEFAARSGAAQRWELAAALLRIKPTDGEDFYPDFNLINEKYAISLLRTGDLAAYRAAVGRRFTRVVGGRLKAIQQPNFLWECLLAPDAVGDPDALVRLAETLLKESPEGPLKAQFMRALGAAYYRAGRFDRCIARIEESIRMRGGESQGRDWAFLAMALARKGRRPEAMSWLKRLPTVKAADSPIKFWEEQRMKIHSAEAEAVVLYDPIFPADPFAH
jgi:tetratricopeptide (TPR) repeat protein